MSLRFLPFALLGTVACGSGSSSSGAVPFPPDTGGVPTDASHADASMHDTGASSDGGMASHDAGHGDDDVLSDDDGAASGTALHDCADDRFVDRGAADSDRMIVATGDNRYAPPCMMIRAGQSVTFMSNFASHPLAPGVAPRQSGVGTMPSPIQMQPEGTTYSVRFPSPGDYPFYCVYHAGGGMYGVVRVMP